MRMQRIRVLAVDNSQALRLSTRLHYLLNLYGY